MKTTFVLPPNEVYSKPRGIEVDILAVGKLLHLSSPYNKSLIEIFRQFEGARWKPETKVWTIKNHRLSLRNSILLGYHTRGQIGHRANDPSNLNALFERARLYYSNPMYPLDKDPVLKSYQLEMANHILTVRHTIAGYEMGLGKTLAFLRAMQYLKKTDRLTGEIWVVAPLTPLLAWAAEIKKWEVVGLPIKFIPCSIQAITKAATNTSPPQVLCLDESSRFKNPSAQRTLAIREITKYMLEAHTSNCYITLMTGTPAPKDPTDWWTQQEICFPGLLRHNSKKNLLKVLAETEQQEGQFGGIYTEIKYWKEKEINLLYRRMKPTTIVKFKKDCEDLPEKTYTILRVIPTEETVSAAKIIASNASTVLEALMKIRQLSDGFQYRANKSSEYEDDIITDEYLDEYFQAQVNDKRIATFKTPKDDALIGILESLRDSEKTRCVVYTGFRASARKIKELCLNAGWNVIFSIGGSNWTYHRCYNSEMALEKGQATQEQFQDHDLDNPIVFVATVGSAGMGITLHASDTIVYYSNDFNAENRIQSEDRIHRLGMGASANIIDIFHLPTDEHILNIIKKKRLLQDLSMGEVLSVLDKVLTEDII